MCSFLLTTLLQLNWTEWITRRFGFLTGWFGRGMFYLFVGTNIMNLDEDAGLVVLTLFFGFAVCFAGAGSTGAEGGLHSVHWMPRTRSTEARTRNV